jgi:uncharacterized protein (TIGR00725 family)
MKDYRLEHNLYEKHFRLTIFGSARIKKYDNAYKQVYELAKLIGDRNIDIVTGGGPGIMEAACKGHHDGRKTKKTHTIGLNIIIPDEQIPNRHLDIKKDFELFSERLDNFMLLSDVVVVAPGGIGTLLELAYTWQLVQVHHICDIPIILMGDMWVNFYNWIKDNPLKKKFLSKKDLENIFLASDFNEAFRIIRRFHDGYLKGDDICRNFNKYRMKINKDLKKWI